MEQMKKVPVMFLQSMSPYGKGEIAGFLEERSQELVKHRMARYLSEEEIADLKAKEPKPAEEKKEDLGPTNRMMETDKSRPSRRSRLAETEFEPQPAE